MIRTRRSAWLAAGCLYAVAIVLGLIAFALIGVDVGVNGFALGLVMACVPVPFYVAFALWVDRFEPEPNWLLGLAFLWGAAIAVFFALIFNAIDEELLTTFAGATAGRTLAEVLAAPIVEELTKGAALFLLFLAKRDEFDNVTDGIVYASMVGLGFAMTENVQYYGHAVAKHQGPVAVFFVRGILSPFAHPLFSSMTGIGLGVARETLKPATRWLAPLAGLAAEMLLHADWNFSANLGLGFLAAYVLVMMPAFFAVIVIAIFSLRREAKLIRAYLAGVLRDDDIAVLCSVRARIAATFGALLAGGFTKWAARRRYHALATELAFHAWRTSREPCPNAHEMRMSLLEAIRDARARL